jgi:hypothetical protein
VEQDPRERLTEAQRRAMFLVAKGERSTDVISQECHVSPVRVSRWLRSPRFRRAMEAQRRDPWLSPEERLAAAVGISLTARRGKRTRTSSRAQETMWREKR